MRFDSSVFYFLFLLLQNTLSVRAQSYVGCHSHGTVECCYGPDGGETPMTALSTAASTATNVNMTGPATISATPMPAAQTTAVTACYRHGAPDMAPKHTGTPTGEPPAQYTGCHSHGDEQFCLGPGIEILIEGATRNEPHSSDEGHGHKEEGSGDEHCHFHAGFEHCVGTSESDHSTSTASCECRDREYNVPLRIGSLFVILVSSGIAVYGPILYSCFFHTTMNGIVFVIIKQFGTGVMIATALVHLLTHAQLMFTNECLGELSYEARTAAVMMAGIFLSFSVEYLGNRFVLSRTEAPTQDRTPNAGLFSADKSQNPSALEAPVGPSLVTLGHHHHSLSRPDDKLSVLVMEAGVIFHSVLIGLTLVVAGDTAYVSLFIVIIFHQMFEGLALGARIAALSDTKTFSKLPMALIYALITPIGMVVGLGAIHTFNGNDPGTIIAIGTLDALSAGILIWVALIDMWSHDWLYGDLKDSDIFKTSAGLVSLFAGMILMGLLGKWA